MSFGFLFVNVISLGSHFKNFIFQTVPGSDHRDGRHDDHDGAAKNGWLSKWSEKHERPFDWKDDFTFSRNDTPEPPKDVAPTADPVGDIRVAATAGDDVPAGLKDQTILITGGDVDDFPLAGPGDDTAYTAWLTAGDTFDFITDRTAGGDTIRPGDIAPVQVTAQVTAQQTGGTAGILVDGAPEIAVQGAAAGVLETMLAYDTLL